MLRALLCEPPPQVTEHIKYIRTPYVWIDWYCVPQWSRLSASPDGLLPPSVVLDANPNPNPSPDPNPNPNPKPNPNPNPNPNHNPDRLGVGPGLQQGELEPM